MPRKKKNQPIKEETKEESKKKEVVVEFEGGKRRIYSEEVHGKDFEKLAKEFVSKKPESRKVV